MFNLQELMICAEAIAREAGEAIMEIYAGETEVTLKADSSPLTEADRRSDRLIRERLQQLTPEIPVLSEEATEAFAGPNADGRYWLVDPLDGTKEFIKRNGEFTVNIALIEGAETILGVVDQPAAGRRYSGARNLGAYRTDGNRTRVPIASAARRAGSPWRVVGSRSHAAPGMNAFLDRLGAHRIEVAGSSLKFCLIAEGRADLYPRFGPTSLWDTAAAQCVLEQAGGRVLGAEGRPLRYDRPTTLLNPQFLAVGAASVADLEGLFPFGN